MCSRSLASRWMPEVRWSCLNDLDSFGPGGTMRIRAFAVGLVLLTPALVPQAVAATSAATKQPRAVELAGTTTITASRIGTVRVVLPRAVRIDLRHVGSVFGNGPLRDARVSGSVGRLTGVVMVAHADRSKPFKVFPSELHVLRSGLCQSPHCRVRDQGYTIGEGTGGPRGGFQGIGTVPAGVYDLIAIADGAPMTVVIHFEGLAGSRTISTFGAHSTAIFSAPDQVIRAGASERHLIDGRGEVFVPGQAEFFHFELMRAGRWQEAGTTCGRWVPPDSHPLTGPSGCPGPEGSDDGTHYGVDREDVMATRDTCVVCRSPGYTDFSYGSSWSRVASPRGTYYMGQTDESFVQGLKGMARTEMWLSYP